MFRDPYTSIIQKRGEKVMNNSKIIRIKQNRRGRRKKIIKIKQKLNNLKTGKSKTSSLNMSNILKPNFKKRKPIIIVIKM